MAPAKCCVVGCNSTKHTQRLFCLPKNIHLRNLWMSFLVPKSPCLLGLSENQLMTKRVCEKHFDQTQFDEMGARIRYSYPCLFSEDEFIHGVPLSSGEYNVLNEHNYFNNHGPEDDTEPGELTVLTGMTAGDVLLQEHLYTLPSSPQSVDPTDNRGPTCSRKPLMDISNRNNISATSKLGETPLHIPKDDNVAGPLVDLDPCVIKKSSEDVVLPRTTKRRTLKGVSAVKGFKAKTRRFIKETTKIAAESIGQNAKERLQNAHIQYSLGIMHNFESLNKKAKAFLLMQLRLARQNKMARRFTWEEKLFALALMKQSPKGYKLLEHMFALPNKRTLARLAEKMEFECGMNQSTFNHIKQCTKNWDMKKRLCSVVFDEVALTPHLTYNENKDIIVGFQEIAGERRPKFADHALVFMIRGICSSWRQSIAYYFCNGTVSAGELERILKELIPRLSEAGVKPLALVCDQGSTFRSCFKNLQATTARLQTPHQISHDTVHVAGHELLIFHDPPHLLKSVRNNFLDKDIVFDGKRASWKDILYVYDLDLQAGHTRALPKLTADHVDPKRIKKMKVKMAAQVLSAQTAAMLNFINSVHERLNKPAETIATTAALVLFFDELFDSVNGSPGQGRGKLRCAVKINSVHIEFWEQAVRKLKSMKYIDNVSKLARRTGQPRLVRVPCLDGWIITLNSFISLAKHLFTVYNLEYFYPRLINQDPLENFFGRIRAMNYRNVNPNTNSFMNTFKSLAISNILVPHSKTMNCEDDDGETLIDLSFLFSTTEDAKQKVQNLHTPSSSSLLVSQEVFPSQMSKDSVLAERIKVQTSAYTAGYLCRKLNNKIKCKVCPQTYTTREHEGIHEYIRHREYKRLKQESLCYPNARILRLYRECAQIIHDYLNLNCHISHVKNNISKIIQERCDMSWLGCNEHKIPVRQYLTSLIIRLQVHNWTKIINKILNGKIEEKYVLKMKPIHMLALNKYKSHRLRQKCTKSNK